MNIGILGSGDVAKSLAAGLIAEGHSVMLGTRDAAKLGDWQRSHMAAKIGSFVEAARFGEVIVLSVRGSAGANALKAAGAANIDGKVIIDTTNPIADAAPVNGVLKFFTDINKSLMETLQAEFPQALFVKAFNSVGAGQMVHPTYSEGIPSMFICGNNETAKQTVSHWAGAWQIWARQRRRALSNHCACCGAYSDSTTMNGRTRLNCYANNFTMF
jgi:predicted dinucleotide-binding enzyme